MKTLILAALITFLPTTAIAQTPQNFTVDERNFLNDVYREFDDTGLSQQRNWATDIRYVGNGRFWCDYMERNVQRAIAATQTSQYPRIRDMSRITLERAAYNLCPQHWDEVNRTLNQE